MIQQKGYAHTFLVVGLVVALVGVLGFVFWQNFINKKDASEPVDDNKQATTQSTETPESAAEESKDPNEGYLVLKDWGIKFKLPENSGEIHYYKKINSSSNDSYEYYSFSTKRVEGLGERCAPDAEGGQILLSSVSRTQAKFEGPFMSSVAANNNEPINGYYYYVTAGQSTCSMEQGDWQGADNLMTFNMLQSPIELE